MHPHGVAPSLPQLRSPGRTPQSGTRGLTCGRKEVGGQGVLGLGEDMLGVPGALLAFSPELTTDTDKKDVKSNEFPQSKEWARVV